MRRFLAAAMLALATACGDSAGGPDAPPPPKSFPFFQAGKFGFINASGEVTIKPDYDFWGTMPVGIPSGKTTSGPEGATVAGTVSLGSSASGRLPQAATAFWLIRGSAGSLVTIDLTSGDFDTVMELFQFRDGSWQQLTQNDDGGNGSDSRLSWFHEGRGPLGVRVSAYQLFGGNGGGAYTLTVSGNAESVYNMEFLWALRFIDGRMPYRLADVWGFLAEDGTVAVTPQFERAWRFSEGLAAVQQKDRWGFVDVTGKVVIQPQYDAVSSFSEGLAVAQMGERCGYLGRDGVLAVGPQYDQCGDFHGGLAIVRDDERYGAIDKKGEIVIAPQFVELSNFVGEYAAARIGEKWGIVDRTGKLLLQPQYDGLLPPVEGDLWLVVSGKRYGFINLEGKFVVSPTHDDAGLFRGGVARVKIGERWGFVTPDGKPVGAGPQYEDADDMVNGLAAVRLGERWGFVNAKGEMIIPPTYAAVGRFEGALAAVMDEDRLGYIDRTGKVVRAPSN